MDGKGRWTDNVFGERLWKSVKYEEVYLRAYDSIPEAKVLLGRDFDFYNTGDRTSHLTEERRMRFTSSICRRKESRYDQRTASLIQMNLLSK